MVETGDWSFGVVGYLVWVGHGERNKLRIEEKWGRAILVELVRLGNGERGLWWEEVSMGAAGYGGRKEVVGGEGEVGEGGEPFP